MNAVLVPYTSIITTFMLCCIIVVCSDTILFLILPIPQMSKIYINDKNNIMMLHHRILPYVVMSTVRELSILPCIESPA